MFVRKEEDGSGVGWGSIVGGEAGSERQKQRDRERPVKHCGMLMFNYLTDESQAVKRMLCCLSLPYIS